MDELVSIIIPIYKVEKYIRKCIESIINQTFSNIEIILVDDGSPDMCPQICDEYAKIDNRITVIHQENAGLSAARNSGIKASKGEYIGFVDGDDYIAPEMYQVLFDNIKKYKADMAICNYEYVNEIGKVFDRISPIKTEVLSNIQTLRKLEEPRWSYYVPAWNKLYRRFLWNDISFPVGKLNEDCAIMHELVYTSSKIVSVEDKLYYYVQRDNSIMSNSYSVGRLDEVEAIYKRYQYYEKQGLCELLPHTPDVMKQVYCNVRGKVSVKSKDERARTKEIDNMFREVYFSNRENVTIINKLKFSTPDRTFAIRRILTNKK